MRIAATGSGTFSSATSRPIAEDSTASGEANTGFTLTTHPPSFTPPDANPRPG
jgi:hypothetical protein